ncbi:MAG: sugar kinase [Isosphaeraceae bacterium]
MAVPDKLVIVTRRTALEELVDRFNTRDQARFYIEHMGGRFDDYQAAHDAYYVALSFLRVNLPLGVRHHWIDRSFLPTYTFGESDVVVILGQDGLVVNAAKYLNGQAVVALNPDPLRVDGVLLPFAYPEAARGIALALGGARCWREVTMAQATLNDGQSLLAVNDLFIGQKTHTSARYRIQVGGREEDQSSSGIIVSTGAGSTGWYRSILTGAAGIVADVAKASRMRSMQDRYRFDWEARQLVFSVREPFISKTSGALVVHGTIDDQAPLTVISHMPQNGVIFSDGVEEDHIDFNSGAIATIGLAERTLRLVMPQEARLEAAATMIRDSAPSRSGGLAWRRGP